MPLHIYKCCFESDNGAAKTNQVEFIVSKKILSKDEILQELYKIKPYSDYDTYINRLLVIPIVITEDVQVLRRR